MGFRQVKFLLVCCILAFALENSEAFAQSLLKGATPSSVSVPSGWRLYYKQDFESGLNTGLGEFIWGSILTDKPHGGARSAGGVINGYVTPPGWGFESFPETEAYLSWWEWVDSNARFNTEFAEFQVLHNNPFEEFWWTWYYESAFNRTTARMSAVTNGPKDQAIGNPSMTVPTGAWHQYEVHWKANTAGQANGSAQIYIDGVLNKSVGPLDLNDSVTMTNSRISIGGTYTKLIWRRADGSCGTFEGDGTTPPPVVCSNYSACACFPNPAIFNRYFDDIIVLVPGSGGGGDTTPPNPPTGLSFK